MVTILSAKHHHFPPIHLWGEDDFFEEDIVAVGGDLHAYRLVNAYKLGIFPWYDTHEPILWWSPKKRAILFFDRFHLSKNMHKQIRKTPYEIRYNTIFPEVIKQCQIIKRKGKGSWIHDEMLHSYTALHHLGFAKSIEVYLEGELVGGLYGVDMGRVFCGESMFSVSSGASRVAMYYLCESLKRQGYYFIDCQFQNDYLASMGAVEVPRSAFLSFLRSSFY